MAAGTNDQHNVQSDQKKEMYVMDSYGKVSRYYLYLTLRDVFNASTTLDERNKKVLRKYKLKTN
jgi:hypothetical protein